MTRPLLQVQVAFANDPFTASASLTWTTIPDISIRLAPQINGSPISIRRGKQSEFANVEAGTLTLRLDNRDRAFDSEYASSPYYPNVKPRKRIRVRASTDGGSTWRQLFTGYVERWEPKYIGFDAVVDVTASDAFKLLASAQVSFSDGAAAAGTAISHVLDQINWPAADRYTSGTNTTIPAATYTNQNALQLMQSMADAEAGTFFVEYDGFVAIHNRYYRTVAQANPFATFGLGSGEDPYVDVGWSYSDAYLANEVHVTRSGGTEQIASDSASDTAFGTAVQTKSGMLLGTDTEALSLANWLLRRGKTPALRIESLVLNGDLKSAMWPNLINRILDEHLRIKFTVPGSASIIQKDGYIIGITHEITGDQWLTTWRLIPTDAETVWVLGDSINGVLGMTTYPAY